MSKRIRKLPPLYGQASTGKVKIWEIRVEREGREGPATIITKHGYEDGALQEARVVVEKGKNLGRSNATDPFEQACLEAQAKWNKKRDRNYVEQRQDVGKSPSLLPMLALEYKKRSRSIQWPALGQPKLNGVRCLATKVDQKTIRYTSREGKEFSVLEHLTPHILPLLKVGETLDGELFTWELTFQEICSAVKREKTVNPNTRKLQFWIYDTIQDQDFVDRNRYLRELLPRRGPLAKVLTRRLKGPEDVDGFHNQMVAAGYEGAIIRNRAGGYRCQHRSPNLQKLKNFIDEEFEIIGGKEGVGKDKGAITFLCITEEGKEFECRPRGTYEQRRAWWKDLPNLIGKKLTVRYQNRTDENKPYLPIGIVIRDYE